MLPAKQLCQHITTLRTGCLRLATWWACPGAGRCDVIDAAAAAAGGSLTGEDFLVAALASLSPLFNALRDIAIH